MRLAFLIAGPCCNRRRSAGDLCVSLHLAIWTWHIVFLCDHVRGFLPLASAECKFHDPVLGIGRVLLSPGFSGYHWTGDRHPSIGTPIVLSFTDESRRQKATLILLCVYSPEFSDLCLIQDVELSLHIGSATQQQDRFFYSLNVLKNRRRLQVLWTMTQNNTWIEGITTDVSESLYTCMFWPNVFHYRVTHTTEWRTPPSDAVRNP
jgi:hypothetical protein